VSSLPGPHTGQGSLPGLDDVPTCIKGGALDCYLLDDAGSVVAANHDAKHPGGGDAGGGGVRHVPRVGSFFGVADPLGFDKLIDAEIYYAKEFYNYQVNLSGFLLPFCFRS
jgi:hypothetical protein